jgi:hypothetical protein
MSGRAEQSRNDRFPNPMFSATGHAEPGLRLWTAWRPRVRRSRRRSWSTGPRRDPRDPEPAQRGPTVDSKSLRARPRLPGQPVRSGREVPSRFGTGLGARAATRARREDAARPLRYSTCQARR